jgi:hypothetical protein
MSIHKLTTINILLLAICLLGIPRDAFAYLDPGTGSYIFQLLIAGLLGALFAIKVFWIRIKTFLAGLFSKKNKDD